MLFQLLRLVLREQASPIFEGVVEIRIKSHLERENKLDNTTHVSHGGNMSGHLS
jgi:hypothetical protein